MKFISNRITMAAVMMIALSAASYAGDFSASGTITLARVHSNQHPVAAVRGVTAFQLSSSLQSRCLWLVISSDDKNTLAHFLAAQAAGRPMTVGYSDVTVPPWGDTGSCYVTSIDRI